MCITYSKTFSLVPRLTLPEMSNFGLSQIERVYRRQILNLMKMAESSQNG